jgi:LAS superfamily LD-carboxypeptidase LdcB
MSLDKLINNKVNTAINKKLNEDRRILNSIRKNLISEESNGKLSNLVSIAGVNEFHKSGHKLNPEAAAKYKEMVKAAAKDNVSWGITDSYRSYEQQVDVAKRKGLYSKGGLAAKPGTSYHGWGSAVDLDFYKGKGKQKEWLDKNASKFGFKNIPREPWHWQHTESGSKLKKNQKLDVDSKKPLPKSKEKESNSSDESILDKIKSYFSNFEF